MIPVKAAPEPAGFDTGVRTEGRRFLRKARLRPPVAGEKWRNKEYWRRAIPGLFKAYGGFCAFTAFPIHPVTGWRTVEHFRPKSLHPNLAYEWSNLRLVCGLMNGRKGDHEDVLDPFTLPPNTFDINFVSGEIVVHNNCAAAIRPQAVATIKRLKLNDPQCRAQRRDDARRILKGEQIRDDNPFVAHCLEAQGLL